MAEKILFSYGVQSSYDSLLTKDPNTLYCITDTQRIYKGLTLLADRTNLNVTFTDSIPEAASSVENMLYIATVDNKTTLWIKSGSMVVQVGGGEATELADGIITLSKFASGVISTSFTTGDNSTLPTTKAVTDTITSALGKITSFDIDSNGGAGYASLAALKEAHPEGTKGVFYLVVNSDASTDNAFVEYFWTGTAYEMAGKFGDVDTSDLATKTELTDGLALKVDKTTTVNGQALSGNVTITNITGNSNTTNKLKTSVKINGVDFDGSKDITLAVGSDSLESLTDTTITDAAAGNSLVYDGNTSKWANKTLTKTDIGLGNVDNTADANKNVASAGKLTTARTITFIGDATGSVDFDGSKNISVALDVQDSNEASHATSADSAIKATQDASGNVITETYATKTELTNSTLVWNTI